MQQRILLGLVLVLSPWLFLAGPDYHSPRSWQLGWQLGHVVLFFAAAGVFLGMRVAPADRVVALAIVVLGAVLAGGGIELLQLFTKRDASWSDVRLDVCGAALAPALLYRSRTGSGRGVASVVGAITAGLLLVMDLRPLAVALVDEEAARQSFPVLSDLESPFERGRWKADGTMEVIDDTSRDSRVLAVQLSPGSYPGFRMTQFPRDWRQFETLKLDVFVPVDGPETLSCRIHDIAHDSDNRFLDRYNTRLALAPGWNRLRIALAAVQSAPRGRRMNMDEIAGFGCFFPGLGRPLEVRVDNVTLGANEPP